MGAYTISAYPILGRGLRHFWGGMLIWEVIFADFRNSGGIRGILHHEVVGASVPQDIFPLVPGVGMMRVHKEEQEEEVDEDGGGG